MLCASFPSMPLLLQSLAPVFYFLCTRIFHNFIINFVVTTVLIVVEFWYTKNIVGRRLCGMRWWQVPSAGGSGTTWRFEHRALDQVRTLAAVRSKGIVALDRCDAASSCGVCAATL